MNHCCLQVELELAVAPDVWLARCESAVPTMRRLPGLVWKLWVLDADASRAGGVYLFQNAEAARAYAEGPVLEHLRASPAVKNVGVRLLPVVDALSRQTFGLPATAPGELSE